MTIWTYEIIDWDLLRDDLDYVRDISPRRAWTTEEAAVESAKKDLADIYFPDDDPMTHDADMTWTRTDDGLAMEAYDGLTVKVYSMAVDA